MDRPSERRRTLDPTTSTEREPASPAPERPDETARAEPPGGDDPGTGKREPDAADDGERDGGSRGDAAGRGEADDAAAVADASDGLGDGPASDGTRAAAGDDATGDDAAGESAPGDDASGDDASGGDTTDAAGAPAASADAAGDGAAGPAGDGHAEAGVDVPAGTADDEAADDGPVAEPSDNGPVAESAADGPADDGPADDEGADDEAADDGPAEAAGDTPAEAADNVGEAPEGAPDEAPGTPHGGGAPALPPEDAERPAAADTGDGNTRAPVDMQMVALSLVEAATEDAAAASPASTSQGPGGAVSAEPEISEPVPPFPMPVRPASSARNPYGTARAAVERTVRDLRSWWTGGGADGGRAAEAATRNRRVVIGTAAGVVGLLTVYAGLAAAQADVVPGGTTVAGVDVGGQHTAEAAETLAGAFAGPAAEPVELVAGEAATTLDPVAAGLSVDAPATAESLTGFSLSPVRMWRHLFGAGPAGPVVHVNAEAFATALDGLEEATAIAPVDGAIEFTDDRPAATPARDGAQLDAAAAGRVITSAWLVVDGPVELPTLPVSPQITQEETDAALARAEKIVSGPVEVSVGGQQAQLPPEVLASAVSFVADDGELVPRFDGATLRQAIVERTDDLLSSAEGAQFGFESGTPEVVGGDLGTTLADEPLRAAIRTAALGDDRAAALEVVRQTPENSTQALRAMGIDEVVAEFSTPLTSDYVRTKNLVRGAQMITGDLIRPGETYSLVSALSPISLANGYVKSGMIIGGHHIDGVGGGLSQMATTTYNAAMIAGFEDVEHHTHSYWFERYPAGREATIAVGSKDMRVKNNTPYGAVLQSWVADNQLHVRIWSTKYYENTWIEGAKRNIVPRSVVRSTDPGCIAYPGGQPGFTITVGRKVERVDDGKVVIDRSYTTTYGADNALACVTPEPPTPPEDPGDQSSPTPPDPGGDTAPTPPGPDA
ncbi:VanW family protein [Myceligenerans indicum]|uniref:Vanomycin resistance protein VanB n=1 Tax=Myceligenerans indicum TaxID=2593663 RepID=A0ABS1LHH0_9MICO|nr:VanW family protein [Myceligenerans indicum]MBL0885687.1 vanomycin resistance protein VanB [Myceligenerans indicum]